MRARAHVFVSGMVQGVFFRSNARSVARLKKVNGWVKNLPDGRVEAVIEGERDSVEEMVEFLRSGPSGSRVDSVDVEWERPSYKYTDFDIRV